MQPGRGAPAPAALPAGAKDVLAVEAAELRQVEAALRAAFGAFGYREVMTPVLEFAEVIDRAQEGGPARRLPPLRRRGARAGAAPGHHDPDRPPRGDPDGRPPRAGARLLRGAGVPPAGPRAPAGLGAAAGRHRAGGGGGPGRRRRGDRAAGPEPARHGPRGAARGRGRRVADARRARRPRHRAGDARRAQRGARRAELRRVAAARPRGPARRARRRAPAGAPLAARRPRAPGADRPRGAARRAGLRSPLAGARPRRRPRRGRRGDPGPGRAPRLALLLRGGRRGLCAGRRRADRRGGALRRAGRPLRPAPPRRGLRDHARPAAPGADRRGRRAGPAARRGRAGGRPRRRSRRGRGRPRGGARRSSPCRTPGWTPRRSRPPTAGAGWPARSPRGYAVLDRATGESRVHARLEEAVSSWV